jgi:hypothetical protein
MGKISKNFTLILILSIVISSQSLVITNFAQAQNNAFPTISIIYPTNDTVFNVEFVPVRFNLEYQTIDTLSWVGYSIDGDANVTVAVNGTEVLDSEGTGYHNLTLYANDTEGHWATPQTVIYYTNFHGDAVPLVYTLFAPLVIVVILVFFAVVLLVFFKKHKKNKPSPQSP